MLNALICIISVKFSQPATRSVQSVIKMVREEGGEGRGDLVKVNRRECSEILAGLVSVYEWLVSIGQTGNLYSV